MSIGSSAATSCMASSQELFFPDLGPRTQSAVGGYFMDVQAKGQGVQIDGMTVMNISAGRTVMFLFCKGSHAGKETVPAMWTLAGQVEIKECNSPSTASFSFPVFIDKGEVAGFYVFCKQGGLLVRGASKDELLIDHDLARVKCGKQIDKEQASVYTKGYVSPLGSLFIHATSPMVVADQGELIAMCARLSALEETTVMQDQLLQEVQQKEAEVDVRIGSQDERLVKMEQDTLSRLAVIDKQALPTVASPGTQGVRNARLEQDMLDAVMAAMDERQQKQAPMEAAESLDERLSKLEQDLLACMVAIEERGQQRAPADAGDEEQNQPAPQGYQDERIAKLDQDMLSVMEAIEQLSQKRAPAEAGAETGDEQQDLIAAMDAMLSTQDEQQKEAARAEEYIRGHDERIAKLDQDMLAVMEALEGSQQREAPVVPASAEEYVKGQDERIAKLDQDMLAVMEALEGLQQKQAPVMAAGVEEYMKGQDERIAKLDQDVLAVMEALEGSQQKEAPVVTAGTEEYMKGQDERIAKLDQDMLTVMEALEGSQQKEASVKAGTETQQDMLAAMERIAKLEEDMAARMAVIDERQQKQALDMERIAKLEEDMAARMAAIDERQQGQAPMEAGKEAQDERISRLEQDMLARIAALDERANKSIAEMKQACEEAQNSLTKASQLNAASQAKASKEPTPTPADAVLKTSAQVKASKEQVGASAKASEESTPTPAGTGLTLFQRLRAGKSTTPESSTTPPAPVDESVADAKKTPSLPTRQAVPSEKKPPLSASAKEAVPDAKKPAQETKKFSLEQTKSATPTTPATPGSDAVPATKKIAIVATPTTPATPGSDAVPAIKKLSFLTSAREAASDAKKPKSDAPESVTTPLTSAREGVTKRFTFGASAKTTSPAESLKTSPAVSNREVSPDAKKPSLNFKQMLDRNKSATPESGTTTTVPKREAESAPADDKKAPAKSTALSRSLARIEAMKGKGDGADAS